jgi:hypothetical protein
MGRSYLIAAGLLGVCTLGMLSGCASDAEPAYPADLYADAGTYGTQGTNEFCKTFHAGLDLGIRSNNGIRRVWSSEDKARRGFTFSGYRGWNRPDSTCPSTQGGREVILPAARCWGEAENLKFEI